MRTLSNCSGFVIQDCIFGPGDFSVELKYCHDITIRNCSFYDLNYAVRVFACSNNKKIYNNKCSATRMTPY
jgi:hypothetical protein